MLTFRQAKETLFGMQFVMTDGRQKTSHQPMRGLVFLFLIDVCQVLRVLMSPKYGWNQTTYDVAKHIDMVYNTTALLELVVPRYTFFGLAFLMVSFALGDAIYCMRLFKAGEIDRIGPVKALRFMVAVMVTTLFSSVMKWLLIPLDCLVSNETSFSSYFHGEDARCTPLVFPEILATVPTMVIMGLYIMFALTASFFSLGTNPLACEPHVQYTGRVEALYITTKVAGTFLVFFSEAITPVSITAINLVFASAVMWQHIRVLPFHNLGTNMLRGGTHASILWLSFASLVVSVLGALHVVSDDTMQLTQWLLMGMVPMAFPCGVFWVHRRHNRLKFSIDRLRGEYETQAMLQQQQQQQQHQGGGDGQGPADGTGRFEVDACPTRKALPGRRRDVYSRFFDPSWERKRAFSSGTDAHTVARALLLQRSEGDLPFLKYVVARGIEEYPESEVLQVFRISLLRFVFRQTQESSAEEKRIRNSHKALALDHEYVLYAAERKAAQDYAASSIGNGDFNAINLMEFESGMQQARAAHLQCVVEIRKFWSGMSARGKSKEITGADGSIDRLVEFNKSVDRAKTEYQALLDKYPQSLQLINAYAGFCDLVLNDHIEANERRKQASLLMNDDAPEDERTAENLTRLETATEQSGTTDEDARIKLQKTFTAWSGKIFGSEVKMLSRWSRILKICFFLLFCTSMTGFMVMQYWVFKGKAQNESHKINKTGLTRTLSITACFLMRSMLMAAHQGDDAGLASTASELREVSQLLQDKHWENYDMVRTDAERKLYADEVWQVNVPTVHGWELRNVSYWAFGLDWARRVDRVSTATAAQLRNSDYGLTRTDDVKLSMQFVHENVFRVAVPAQETATSFYESQIENLWVWTETVMLSSLLADTLLLLVIALLFSRQLLTIMGELQHLYLAGRLACVLPLAINKRICAYYSEAEKAMMSMEDEEEAKRQLEQAPPETSGSTTYSESRSTPDLKVASKDAAKQADDEGDDDEAGTPNMEEEEDPKNLCRVVSLSSGNLAMFQCAMAAASGDKADDKGVDEAFKIEVAGPDDADQEQDHGLGGDGAIEASPPHLEVASVVARDTQVSEVTLASATEEAVPDHEMLGPTGRGAWATAQDSHCKQGIRLALALRVADADGQNLEEDEEQQEGAADNAGEALRFSVESPTTKQSPMMRGVARMLMERSGSGNTAKSVLRPVGSEDEGSWSRRKRTTSVVSWSSGPAAPDVVRDGDGGAGLGGLRAQIPALFGEKAATPGEEEGDKGEKVIDDEEGEGEADERGLLPLRRLEPEKELDIARALQKHQHLSSRHWIWACALLVTIVLGVLAAWYPAHRIGNVMTLAPTINQAGRRRTLVRVCVHLARELVFADGFSRMHKAEVAAALDHYLQELRVANDAVRLGGALGISVGADFRNEFHNEIMYGRGCAWRADPTNCSLPVMPGAAANGLYRLSLSFMDAVEKVLDRYAPARSEWPQQLDLLPRTEGLDEFTTVAYNQTLASHAFSQAPLPFIVEGFDGDLFEGFALIVEVFDNELLSIVKRVTVDNEILFVVYMVFTFGFVYFVLFGRAVAESFREGERARTFIARIPYHALSQLQIDTIAHIFSHHTGRRNSTSTVFSSRKQ